MTTAGKWIAYALLGFNFLFATPVIAAKIAVVYPRPEAGEDPDQIYPIVLLKLALDKAGSSYEMRPSHDFMEQDRALRQLSENSGVSVVWSMTSTEREKDLLPIRIPIDKGLQGWRLFFINGKNAKKFEQVKTLAQLKAFTAGQEHDWPDTQILADNGLKVVQSSEYQSLFRMLQYDRFDYFPRSVAEIWDEQRSHPGMDIEVEPTIALHYPAAEYFFVNRQNKPLAEALERGLRAAIKDGAFEKIFLKYNGEAIKLANLKNRTLLKLENPLLPAETPLEQKDLWLAQ